MNERKWLTIHTFYNGPFYNMRMAIDDAVGGALMNKPLNEAYVLIKKHDSQPLPAEERLCSLGENITQTRDVRS